MTDHVNSDRTCTYYYVSILMIVSLNTKETVGSSGKISNDPSS